MNVLLFQVFFFRHSLFILKVKFVLFSENVGWRYTTIRERANNIISIPNSVLSGSISKNFSSMDSAFRVPIQIGVSYDSDLDHVEKVALEVANDLYENLDCISKSYKPAIRFREFADSSINFFRTRLRFACSRFR